MSTPAARRITSRYLEAQKLADSGVESAANKEVAATVAEIVRVLKGAADNYAKFAGFPEMTVSKYPGTRAKGGYDWLDISVYSLDSDKRFYFLIQITRNGRIQGIYPEIKERQGEGTLERGKKMESGVSYQSIEPKVLADPSNFFSRP